MYHVMQTSTTHQIPEFVLTLSDEDRAMFALTAEALDEIDAALEQRHKLQH